MNTEKRILPSEEKKRILVVDDDKSTLVILESLLSSAGYAVFTATSGREVVNQAKNLMPHLLILDIALPGLDGINVAFKLKEDQETKDIPIIFLSALTRKEIIREDSHSSGSSFLRKPIDKDVLLREIEKYI
jgi:two-component system sensor histidine kinase/response regulator